MNICKYCGLEVKGNYDFHITSTVCFANLKDEIIRLKDIKDRSDLKIIQLSEAIKDFLKWENDATTERSDSEWMEQTEKLAEAIDTIADNPVIVEACKLKELYDSQGFDKDVLIVEPAIFKKKRNEIINELLAALT